jgi:hypothetical protein
MATNETMEAEHPLETIGQDIVEQKGAGRFSISIPSKCSILFVTAIGCLLRSLPITPEQSSSFYGTDRWGDAQLAKISNIV